MKRTTLLALITMITLAGILPSQAGSNPRYPQDHSWDLNDPASNANGGGAGGGSGGGE